MFHILARPHVEFFSLKFPVELPLTSGNSISTGETAWMRRRASTFVVRICYNNSVSIRRLIKNDDITISVIQLYYLLYAYVLTTCGDT